MSITVPPHLRAIAKTVGLKTWADDNNLPRDKYFKSIERFKAELADYSADGSVDSATLVWMIAAAVEAEGALVEHVIKKNGDIADPDAWRNFLLAAGWLIYQRYVREVESGKWTAGDGS